MGLAEVQTVLSELGREDEEFEASARQLFSRPPYEIRSDHPICQALVKVLRERGHGVEPTGMSFWTDAAILAQAGIPAVVFGPCGSGLHSQEEFVELDSLLTCRNVLVDLARNFC